MRRAKLAPGAVPAGLLHTAHSSHSVPLCFVCDEPIKSHRLSTSLLTGRTQYTHSPLPTKIGGYIGDEFVVVVTPQDALCKHCMALINTMDRLELELRQHQFQLIQNLKSKYKLDGHTSKPTSTFEPVGDDGDVEEPDVIEVSDEEWTPNKRQRTDSTKHHRCTLCSATYTNLNMFMAHLSRHKQVEKSKPANLPLSSTVKSSIAKVTENSGQVSYFKCGCCSESFSTKESLGLHMQHHTAPQLKLKVSSVLPAVVNKPVGETMSPALNSELLPTVQTSTLFEDIDELSPQETPISSGACTEEQKGRVCLLALLNNGVCSDLSHRVPVSVSTENSSFTSDECTQPKERKSKDEVTISISLSIPNAINGGKLSKQQLSLPAVPNLSNSSSVPYPVTLSSTVLSSASAFNPFSGECCPISKSDHENSVKTLSGDFRSDMANNCLDLPNLSDSCFEGASKSNNETSHIPASVVGNDVKDQSCTWIGSDSIKNFVTGDAMGISLLPSCRPVQALDMPSLLDEDLLQSDDKNLKSLEEVPESCSLTANSFGNNKVSTNAVATNLERGKQLKDQPDNNIQTLTSSLDSNNMNSSAENIAEVSVTSVQMNSDSCNADSIDNKWFFTHSEKEISSVLEASNVVVEVSPDSNEWYGKNQTAVGEKLLGECNNTGEILAPNNSSQNLT